MPAPKDLSLAELTAQALTGLAPPRPTRPTMGRRGMPLLSDIPLFAGLSKRHLRRVADLAEEVPFQDGRLMVQADSPGQALYVIAEGNARVFRGVVPTGRPIARLGPGDFFEEIALFDGGPRTARWSPMARCSRSGSCGVPCTASRSTRGRISMRSFGSAWQRWAISGRRGSAFHPGRRRSPGETLVTSSTSCHVSSGRASTFSSSRRRSLRPGSRPVRRAPDVPPAKRRRAHGGGHGRPDGERATDSDAGRALRRTDPGNRLAH